MTVKNFTVLLALIVALVLVSAAQAQTYVLYHTSTGSVLVARVMGQVGPNGAATLSVYDEAHLNGNSLKVRGVLPCSSTVTVNCYDA